MKFPQREWVTEIATATVTPTVAALAGALFIPVPVDRMHLVAAAFSGFVVGLLTIPLKWLLEKRPKPPDVDSDDGGQ